MQRMWIIALLAALLTACSGEDEAVASLSATGAAPTKRKPDFASVARGTQLYQANCARCHGPDAAGAPNWRQPDENGFYPPPPLNGTGHTWHHPKEMLRYVIKQGSPGGKGRMPAWREKLTDQQIDDVIAWFMNKWPDEAYQAWYEIDRRSRTGS